MNPFEMENKFLVNGVCIFVFVYVCAYVACTCLLIDVGL